MSKVYVPQVPHRRDKASSCFVPVVDVTRTQEYGEPIIMLPSNQTIYKSDYIVRTVKEHLSGFKKDEDYIVALGDPSILAIVFGILGNLVGEYCLLKWDKEYNRYFKVEIKL